MNSYMPNWTTQKKWKNFQKYRLPRLSQEETDSLNRPITRSERDCKNKQTKSPGPYDFTSELYQTYKELIPILLILFQKIEEEVTSPKTFYKPTVNLITKPDQANTKNRKLHAIIFGEYRCRDSQQSISKSNPATGKKDHAT